MKNTIALLILILSISCNGQKSKLKETDTINADKIDLTDTTYFKAVKNYINTVGTIRKVNASNMANQELIITYYVVYVDSMEILIDHTNRIYMNLNNRHFGNILKENSIVKPEINYGIPDKNPRLTKKKEIRVLEIYKKLIILDLNK
jgi:hypothetical protein